MSKQVSVSSSSVKSLIENLDGIKKELPQIFNDFYYECYLFFVAQCRWYLYQSTIGEDVKSEIALGWQYKRTKKGAKFINRTKKAVFVEFGVGMIGDTFPHENADKLGNSYKYNIGTKIKEDGSWIFNVSDDSDIDIEQEFIENRTEHTIRTKGSPSIMYAYQSLQDLEKEVYNIWERVKAKYWR